MKKIIIHKQLWLKVACLVAACLFAACIEAQAESIITTVAGAGTGGYSGDDGQAAMAELNGPCHVAQDSAGNLYIADTGNNRIRRVDTAGMITTVAGTGVEGYGGDGGPATAARLTYPQDIALDSAGNLYIADTGNNRIRRVDTAGMITTVAGSGVEGYGGDGGPATEAQLQYPQGIALDSADTLYIADTDNQRIRRVDAEGTIYTVAGNGGSGYYGDGDISTAAQLNFPTSIALDSAGNLYIADYNNYVIRLVNTSGIISTFAGIGEAAYSGDGGQAAAAGLCPLDIAIDSADSVYVSDYNNNRIRKIEISGIISTVAGTGVSGYSGDGGLATNAQINYAFSIGLGSPGSFYIADTNNNVIRKVGSGTISIVPEETTTTIPEETTTTIQEDTTTTIMEETTTTIAEETTTIIPEETTTTIAGIIDMDGDGYMAGQESSSVARQSVDFNNVVHTLNRNFTLVMSSGFDCDDNNPDVHPGASDDNCDGIDNNCNGLTDEDYVSQATSCGVGACARTGSASCIAGQVQDSCTPGSPLAEQCNGIDDNCDGQIDEEGICGAPPVLTTHEITDYDKTSIEASGSILDAGQTTVTARGFCWNTTGNPTTADNVISEAGSFAAGDFSASITGLTEDTTYYIRAYATSLAGTGFGDEQIVTIASNCAPAYTLNAPHGTVSDTRPTFTWKQIDGVAWYNVAVYSGAPEGYAASQWFNAATVCNGSECSAQVDEDLNPGDYWWWLNTWSYGPCGYQMRPGGKFNWFKIQLCPVPMLLLPDGNILTRSAKPAFTFSDSGAQWYNVMTWTESSGWVLGLNIWINAAWYCSDGTCTVPSPRVFGPGQTWWWINSWSFSCGYQEQSGGVKAFMVY